jgi:hypothetical protein
MTITEIHGKATNTNSEDQLTADVFGAFRYLPADFGLIGFLRSVPGLDERIPETEDYAECSIHFWPLGTKIGREPDVLLELDVDGRLFHIVVEAKYFSGPSDYEMVQVSLDQALINLGNQLADQMRDLSAGTYQVFEGSRRSRRFALNSDKADRYLLYLTAHAVSPDDELDRSRKYFPAGASRLFWASWYQVAECFRRLLEGLAEFPCRQIAEDLLTLLDMKGFSHFDGFATLPDLALDNAGGAFWKDRRFGPGVFSGIEPLPSVVLSAQNAAFWRDYRDSDEYFDGISAPDFQLPSVGGFWQPEETSTTGE